MAISKHLINMMGGDISLESETNKGSKFKISVDFTIADNQSNIKLPEPKKDINL